MQHTVRSYRDVAAPVIRKLKPWKMPGKQWRFTLNHHLLNSDLMGKCLKLKSRPDGRKITACLPHCKLHARVSPFDLRYT